MTLFERLVFLPRMTDSELLDTIAAAEDQPNSVIAQMILEQAPKLLDELLGIDSLC